MVPSADGAPRKSKKPVVKTRTPRPDELTRETFEFIAAVDDYKRRRMRSFLSDEEILAALAELGYARGEEGDDVADFAAARETYRHEEGRLFPTWSELFELLRGLGFDRPDAERDEADAPAA